MRIAITGGGGQVGRAVTALALAEGHSVVSIDRAPPPDRAPPGIAFVQADTTAYAEIARALRGCDALVHLAAITSPRHHPDHEVHNANVASSYNALRAAAEVGIARVCQASSINAIGGVFSRQPRYDYFPLDERHPCYAEDPYGLSKWICEQQADAIARCHAGIRIASLRLHWVAPDQAAMVRSVAELSDLHIKQLWGYTRLSASARACLLALTASFSGHEVLYVVAPRTLADLPSLELRQRHYPDVPLRGDLSGHRGFFDCSKAERLLGWQHVP